MESRVVWDTLVDRLGRLFFPAAITGVLLTLALVYLYIDPEFAVFGLYALLGLVGAATIYYGTSDLADDTRFRIDEPFHRTGVYVTAAFTIGIVALTNGAIFVVVGLAVGYALVVRQLFSDPVPERVLPQLVVLFLLSPLVKYLTAGMYFGHGDLLNHTRFIEDMLSGGTVQALTYTSYQDFPGLHILAATVGSFSGLGAYKGLMLTGLAAYAVLLPAIYLIVARLTDYPLFGLYTAFGVAVIDDVSFFASYIFPQSLAMVLIVLLAMLATLVSRDDIMWPVVGTFVLVTLALSVTHHLTQVLFFPIIAVACLVYAAHGREELRSLAQSRGMALILFAGGVTTLRLVQTGFVDRLIANGRLLLLGGTRGGYTEGATLGFGRPARSTSIETAFEWLLSPYGFYLVLLLIVFSIGVVTYFWDDKWPPTQTALFWTGAIGALLIFETPISIKSLIRIRAPWLFLFAFVIAVGMLRIHGRVDMSHSKQALLAVLVVLAAMGPLVTADNYYDLDPRPTVQTSYTDQEAAEMEAIATFARDREDPISTFFLTKLTLQRHHVDGTRFRNGRLEGETVVIPEGHFVYRSRWSDHQVNFVTDAEGQLYSNKMYVSEPWLEHRVATGNKVYTAGGSGIMWRADERAFENL